MSTSKDLSISTAMDVRRMEFTVADFVRRLRDRDITVNRDYQRSSATWPAAARSYLIQTLLLGYPMPKLTLYQQVDLTSRRTYLEIVDGQQRAGAIRSFVENRLRITSRGSFSGGTFETLATADQQRFLEYPVSADIIVRASPREIREMFRRINSYSTPLNKEELRHSIYMGAFKMYILELANRYSDVLQHIGVFTPRQVTRMRDARFFAEIILACEEGIGTYSAARLDRLYGDNDAEFRGAGPYGDLFGAWIDLLLQMPSLHDMSMTKYPNLYSLTLAFFHRSSRFPALSDQHVVSVPGVAPVEELEQRLVALSESLDDEDEVAGHAGYVDAAREGTNTKTNRLQRFVYLSDVMAP